MRKLRPFDIRVAQQADESPGLGTHEYLLHHQSAQGRVVIRERLCGLAVEPRNRQHLGRSAAHLASESYSVSIDIKETNPPNETSMLGYECPEVLSGRAGAHLASVDRSNKCGPPRSRPRRGGGASSFSCRIGAGLRLPRVGSKTGDLPRALGGGGCSGSCWFERRASWICKTPQQSDLQANVAITSAGCEIHTSYVLRTQRAPVDVSMTVSIGAGSSKYRN